MIDREELTIATHDGRFHLDDVVAMAVVQMWVELHTYDWHAIRTRDPEALQSCNIVFDVGGEYDPTHHRFDHHQPGFNEARPNGITYAAAGLVWKQYGLELCSGNEKIWNTIDDGMIQKIDAIDNGITLTQSVRTDGLEDINLHQFLSASMPTWKEDPELMNQAFWWWVEHMRMYLERLIEVTEHTLEGQDRIREILDAQTDKRILVLDKRYPWESMVGDAFAGVEVVVHPDRAGTAWKVETIPVSASDRFTCKVYLPESWAGLRDEQLCVVSGIPDLKFCHRGRHLGVANTKEAAIKMAEQAV